jgi:DNA-binding winged helix-turn-helix (wHTH) protein
MPTCSERQFTIQFGPFTLDPGGEFRRAGVRVLLTDQELKLLELLVAQPGTLLSYKEVSSSLSPGEVPAEKSVDALRHLVQDLRRKLDNDNPDRPKYIKTERGEGLKFIHVVEELQFPAPPATPLISNLSEAPSADDGHRALTPTGQTAPRARLISFSGFALVLAACGLGMTVWTLVGRSQHKPIGNDVAIEHTLVQPVITRVSAINARQVQQIIIEGHGLGTYANFHGLGLDTPFLAIGDDTSDWAAGRTVPNNVDEVTLAISDWTDTVIRIEGFSGHYGQNGWRLRNGDKLRVRVWNPQTGAGPTECALTVGPVGATKCSP